MLFAICFCLVYALFWYCHTLEMFATLHNIQVYSIMFVLFWNVAIIPLVHIGVGQKDARFLIKQ